MENRNGLLTSSRLKVSKLFYPANELTTEIKFSKKDFEVSISTETEQQVVDLCEKLKARSVFLFFNQSRRVDKQIMQRKLI